MLECEPEEEQQPDTHDDSEVDSPLSSDTCAHIQELLFHLDIDGDGSVSVEEAVTFFSEVLPDAAVDPKTASLGGSDGFFSDVRDFFIDVDEDLDGHLTMSELLQFFQGLKRRGLSDDDIVEMCESILQSGTWKEWRANRRLLNKQAWEFEQSDGRDAAPLGLAATLARSGERVHVHLCASAQV